MIIRKHASTLCWAHTRTGGSHTGAVSVSCTTCCVLSPTCCSLFAPLLLPARFWSLPLIHHNLPLTHHNLPPSHTTDPGARTTDPALQDAALQAAAALGRPLFALFAHPAARVADGTAVIMRAIAERGAAAAAPMRDAALREGALLHHLQLALFATGAGARLPITCYNSWKGCVVISSACL